MLRNTARAKAREEKLTIGELRQMIWDKRKAAGARIGELTSAVNPGVPLLKALDVYTASLAGREASEVPKAWRSDPYGGRDKPSGDFLIVSNILRDCA